MADNEADKANGKPDPTHGGRLEVRDADRDGFSGTSSQDAEGKFKVDSFEEGDEVLTAAERAALEGDDEDASGDVSGDETAGDGEGVEEADKAEPDAEDSAAPDPLPDFDPANEEVVAAYEERYFTDDGKINEEALGAVIFANSQKEGGKPELNASDYAFLEAKLGVTREMADAHIAGKIALKEKAETNFYQSVGGKETYEATLAWGKANYTPEQKARFNKIIQGTDQEAIKEQIDLLTARAKSDPKFKAPGPAKAADPKASERKAPPGVRRPVSPAKTASSAALPGGAKALTAYTDMAEYRKDLASAGNDKAAQAQVQKRLAASTFWK